ncbi:flagellar biosynthetic protein FliO [Musicola keenii]|uniref:flagellar biosynthetic protein FliO n=1 Tax=Musicola keenii TaxID=2884250 RepID=UPI0038B3CE13
MLTSTVQPAVGAAPSYSSDSALTQIGVVLGLILVLILLMAWLARKLGFAPQMRQNKMLKVVSSCLVGQRERVVIVEVDNEWLVLGVTPQQITHLRTLPAKTMDEVPAVDKSKPTDFRSLLNKVLTRSEKSE